MVGAGNIRNAFAGLIYFLTVIGFTGCADYGDPWQQPRPPTAEDQARAKADYDRARSARAAGDARAAANHFRDAAELGHANDAYELGLAYAVGDGVPEDLDLSAQWINRHHF